MAGAQRRPGQPHAGQAQASLSPSPRTSSIALSVATLLKNMIGAGIFSLPIGLKMATPLPGLGILCCIGVLSAVSFWMVGYCCLAWQVDSFRKLWHRTLGPNTAWVIDATILLNGWFTLVGYLVLIGDFTTKSFGGLLGEDHLLARSRLLDQWVVTVAVLLPLSLAQDLRRLAFTSVLGLGVTVYVVLLVLRDSWLKAPAEWGPEMVLAEWRAGAFEAIALYTHAFVAHYNAPKLFGELERPTGVRWLFVVCVAYVVAFVVYAAFAFAGLRRFETDVEGNVLRNFEMEAKVLVAWMGMGFSIAFTYPIVFNSAREALVNLMAQTKETLLASPRMQRFMSSPRLNSRRSMSLYNVLGPSPSRSRSSDTTTRITVAFVLCTAAVASVCSDLGLINALAGALMGCAVAFVFPSLLFFQTVRAQLAGVATHTRPLAAPLLGQRGDDRFPTVAQVDDRLRPLLWASLAVAGAVMVAGVGFSILGFGVAMRSVF